MHINKTGKFVLKSLFLGILIFYASNPFTKHYQETDGNNNTIETKEQYSYIDLSNILMFIQNKNAIIIDTRIDSAYNLGHIPSAISIMNIADSRAELSNKTVVLYGNNSQMSEIRTIASNLISKYTVNAMIYSGSWEEWTACALPIEH